LTKSTKKHFSVKIERRAWFLKTACKQLLNAFKDEKTPEKVGSPFVNLR